MFATRYFNALFPFGHISRTWYQLVILSFFFTSANLSASAGAAPPTDRGHERERVAPETVQAPGSLRVLIDASKDGGVWWFPQSGPFTPGQPHQGSKLAAYLRGRGFQVRELPSKTPDVSGELEGADVVVRAGDYQPQTESELRAYSSFLRRGGSLLLLAGAGYLRGSRADPLAESLGVRFETLIPGGTVKRWADHPITRGLPETPLKTGSAVAGRPESSTPLAWLGIENKNALVLGCMNQGRGKVVFMSSILTIEDVPQPLTNRIFDWLASGVGAPQAPGMSLLTPQAPGKSLPEVRE